MKSGQTIRCQACGGAKVTILNDQSLMECQYCGSMMPISESAQNKHNSQAPHKSINLWLLMVIIPVLVIILMAVFWLIFQNTRNNPIVVQETTAVTHPKTEPLNDSPQQIIHNLYETLPTANNYIASGNQPISIQNQVSGLTSNGGKYWIFEIKNNSNQSVARPGVMMSLFNQQGKRVEEQGGWSLQEQLAPGKKTAVLVFISNAPTAILEEQTTPLFSQPASLGLSQVEVSVMDYSVTTKNGQFELIGDVKNNLKGPLKYVKISAVAYDQTGKPIGLGNAYSTVKHLNPNQVSGFKVRVGTFLVGEPVSWQVTALAREP